MRTSITSWMVTKNLVFAHRLVSLVVILVALSLGQGLHGCGSQDEKSNYDKASCDFQSESFCELAGVENLDDYKLRWTIGHNHLQNNFYAYLNVGGYNAGVKGVFASPWLQPQPGYSCTLEFGYYLQMSDGCRLSLFQFRGSSTSNTCTLLWNSTAASNFSSSILTEVDCSEEPHMMVFKGERISNESGACGSLYNEIGVDDIVYHVQALASSSTPSGNTTNASFTCKPTPSPSSPPAETATTVSFIADCMDTTPTTVSVTQSGTSATTISDGSLDLTLMIGISVAVIALIIVIVFVVVVIVLRRRKRKQSKDEHRSSVTGNDPLAAVPSPSELEEDKRHGSQSRASTERSDYLTPVNDINETPNDIAQNGPFESSTNQTGRSNDYEYLNRQRSAYEPYSQFTNQKDGSSPQKSPTNQRSDSSGYETVTNHNYVNAPLRPPTNRKGSYETISTERGNRNYDHLFARGRDSDGYEIPVVKVEHSART
ncbi:hypothetical protein V1264_003201 [Littorina saxatilis]|uniref:MAM domain-containing protein n=3 Tax=Littorina saxatilis TaxID=31220 RepID=A0AAN9B6V6_9CAEN